MDTDLLARAALGDPDAQLAMVGATLQCAVDGTASFPEAVRAAEWWARLAAVHGSSNARMQLASVLMYAAQVSGDNEAWDQSIAYQAECILVLNDLADEGDEVAASSLQVVCDNAAPEASFLALGIDTATRKVMH